MEKIGWFQTTLRHYDNLIEIIPNSQLGMQQVTNLSRVKRCQITQQLRFRYEDAEKLDALLPDILEEIKVTCPETITDGTRPFRAHFTDFREDHLRVRINVHFNIPPIGEAYWNNRDACLKAIHRAVKRNGVEFVTGLYPNGLNN